uniref:Uncharacterized protein n=1 Tax=Cacopsylla melanoneura TaxID=428564 RepID=A0A8D8W1W3_9HEMI
MPFSFLYISLVAHPISFLLSFFSLPPSPFFFSFLFGFMPDYYFVQSFFFSMIFFSSNSFFHLFAIGVGFFHRILLVFLEQNFVSIRYYRYTLLLVFLVNLFRNICIHVCTCTHIGTSGIL